MTRSPAVAPLAVEQMPWTSRTFPHDLPVGLFPALLERARGIATRCGHWAAFPDAVLRFKPGGEWSILEHIGHLLELEKLAEQRLNDFERGALVLSAADMTNRATYDAQYNRADPIGLLARLARERAQIVARYEGLSATVLAARAIHPRLKHHMSPVDLLYFFCEHDDHHLASMRACASAWSRAQAAQAEVRT